MKPDAYMLAVESNQCRAYIRLNGVPLFEADLDRPRDFGEIVSMWIMPGTNKLDVSLALAPNNELASTQIHIAVLRMPDGVDQKSAERVMEFSWPPVNMRELIPFYHVFEFECPPTVPAKLWREAERIVLDEGARAEVTAIAQDLHRMFSQKQHRELADALGYRGRDIALSLGMMEDEGERSQKSFLKTIMQHGDFRAAPWDDAAFQATLIADERVVWLHRKCKTLNEVLLLENNHGQGMDLFVAKIAGRWQVVR
ncbi:MAG TPA: hypothetical protein VI197_12580 [Polyangiaceae bacterium]